MAPATLDLRVGVGLALAAWIAWLQPFDLAFDALTFGQPVLRAAAVVALAVAGLWASSRLHLRIEPAGERSPLLLPVAIAAGVAVFCAAMDVAFRPVLHARYAHILASAPLSVRILSFGLRAFNENIFYRLFLGPVLALVAGKLWPSLAKARPGLVLAIGFLVAQLVNVWINVTSQGPLSPLGLLHDALRYVLPGMVWSWLYWRRGFQANEIASTSVHLFFQPLAGAWLGR